MINLFMSSRLISILAGVVAMFVSIRYLGDYELFPLGLGISILLFASGMLGTFLKYRKAKSDQNQKESQLWKYAMTWQLVVIGSFGAYFLYQFTLGDLKSPETIFQKGALAFWLLTLILGASYGIGVELGIQASGTGESADPARVSRQGNSWLKIGILIGTLLCLNYTAAKKSQGYDLSYLKATVPGESTQSIVKDVKIKVEIGSFFQRDSDVGPQVKEYLDKIASFSDQIELSYYDKDFAPVAAEEFRVAKNGQVILTADKKRQRIDLGEDLATARSKLKKLDQLFQKAFLALVAEKKNIYLTEGHGEMTTTAQTNPLRSASNLAKLLRNLNYNVRTLDAMQGGFGEIPEDAHLLGIVGAAKQFTETEINNIKSFVDRGGSLLVFMDLEFGGEERDLVKSEQDLLSDLLSSYGIKFEKQLLVNEQKHVSATRQKIDRSFLIANNFSSHISVKSLAKNDERLALIVFQSGYLEPSKSISEQWKVTKTVQALPTTFVDLNKNLDFDGAEKRQAYGLGMAAESEKSKIIVFSDATMVSNPILQSPGNQLAVLDSVKWLIGQSEQAGEINSEEDVKIQHSKSRELFVFHGSIYFVPLLVLLVGFLRNRRRKEEA